MKELVRISLTRDEMRLACTGGIEHRLDALFTGQPARDSTPYHLQRWWQSHITGSIAEVAVSKLLGVDWQWERNANGFDVLDYQVRATENAESTLVIRNRDNPDHNFIFAKVRENRVLLEGWITGQEVIANNEPIHEDCWTIKNYRLYPITDLPEFPQQLPDGIIMFTPGTPRFGTVR